MSGTVPSHVLSCYETLLSSLTDTHRKVLSGTASFFDLYALRAWREREVCENVQQILLWIIERSAPVKNNPEHYRETSRRAIEILSWSNLTWREAELDGCTYELREFAQKLPLKSLPHTQMVDDERWYQAISNVRTLKASGRSVPKQLRDALTRVVISWTDDRKRRLYEELYALCEEGAHASISSSAESASSPFAQISPPVFTPWSSSISAL